MVYVEEKDYNSELFQVEGKEDASKIRKFYTPVSSLCDGTCSLKHQDSINEVDLIITLGGDGTILYASTLFQVSTYIVSFRSLTGGLMCLCPKLSVFIIII